MGDSTAETSQRKPHCHQLIVLAAERSCSFSALLTRDHLVKGQNGRNGPVSMGSGDSLQDWSSDSISSHQTQVRSPAVQVVQLQLAQAPIALSLLHYITLITSFCFFSYLVCNNNK